jgi:uncharacterized repeat protein (TIGR01451 family)
MKKKQNRKKGLGKLLSSIFVLVVICQLVLYQCSIPLMNASAIAQETGTETATEEGGEEESEETQEEGSEEESAQETESEETTPPAENTEESENPTETEGESGETGDNPEASGQNSGTAAEDPTVETGAETQNQESSGGEENDNSDENKDEDSDANTEPAASGENPLLSSPQVVEMEAERQECDCEGLPTLPDPSEYCVKICEEVKITNANEAEAENKADSDSNTGNNEISGDCGDNCPPPCDPATDSDCQADPALELAAEGAAEDAAIQTGDAEAAALIVNDINSNKIGCNFTDLIYNITGVYDGDINLYEEFRRILENECSSFSDEEVIAILIENINEALVKNTASASAESGENSISGAGEASISTGDAAALAIIINLINRNLVGDNWLFSVINVLGEWNGDLIVPGEGLLNFSGGPENINLEVTNENSASVNNTAASSASTGGNSAEGSDEAQIETGDAASFSNVLNVINTNIVKNNWFFLMINNAGNWIGSILNWEGGILSNVFSYDFGSNGLNDIASGIGGILGVSNKNEADVENTASASAATGGNSISDSGSASISTGNATAIAHILNFINTNIVGNNWFFAVVNIFGSWNGNLEFAYPDLALSFSDGRKKANPGEVVEFSVNITNGGKAPCEDAQVMVSFPKEIKYLSDSSGIKPAVREGGLLWNMPGIDNGGISAFTIRAKIDQSLSPGNYTLTSAAGVTTSTKEVNLGNNAASDSTNVLVLNPLDGLNPDALPDVNDVNNDLNSHLSITRSIDKAGPINPGELATHTFYITNKSDFPLYNVILEDTVKDENGLDLTIYQWQIGDMEKGQKILVDYTLQANNIGHSVTFAYEAQAYGEGPDEEEIKSRKVSSSLTIFGFMNIAQAASEDTQPAQDPQTPPTEAVLGTARADGNNLFNWAWLLLLIPAGYLTRRYRLYQPAELQRIARRVSHAIFSFF